MQEVRFSASVFQERFCVHNNEKDFQLSHGAGREEPPVAWLLGRSGARVRLGPNVWDSGHGHCCHTVSKSWALGGQQAESDSSWCADRTAASSSVLGLYNCCLGISVDKANMRVGEE